MVLVIRTLILYAVVILSIRIMGKRQLGELQPSELVVAIMISDLASVPMASVDIPIITGIIPVLTLLIAEVVTSELSLKSEKIRKLLTGEPSIVIYDGHINEGELRRLRFNMDDLLEELRLVGGHNIADVKVAVIETSGKLSIILKDEARNVTVEDITTGKISPDGLPCHLISDGVLDESELKRSGKDKNWLEKQLKNQKIKHIGEVFVASLDAQGELFIQKKGEEDKGGKK